MPDFRHRKDKEKVPECGDRCPSCGKGCTLAWVHISKHACPNGHRWD